MRYQIHATRALYTLLLAAGLSLSISACAPAVNRGDDPAGVGTTPTVSVAPSQTPAPTASPPLATAIAASPTPTAAQAALAPEQVVEQFYAWYLAYEGNALADGAYQRSPSLSAAFKEQLAQTLASFKDGGFDPLLCAQDKPTSVGVSQSEVTGDQATVVLQTSFEGHQLTLKLLRGSEGWQINAVQCQTAEVPTPAGEGTASAGELPGGQSYTEAEYGVALQYPADWRIEEARIAEEGSVMRRVVGFAPQGPGWNAAPLYLLIAEGPLDRVRAEANLSATQEGEPVELGGQTGTLEISPYGEKVYLFQHPSRPDTWVLLRDNFTENASDHPQRETVSKAIASILPTLRLTP